MAITALFIRALATETSWAYTTEASLGEVDFPISCGSSAAQSKFNRGVALLHYMMYAQAEKEFKAFLKLEKPKYVLGESIRFWLGVEYTGRDPIPRKYWNTCFLYITKPDGTIKKESVSWPADGAITRSWMGGHGFGKEEVQVGKYTLVFEFAKQKTEPVELMVEELDILKKVIAKFLFGRSGEISKDAHIPIILTVQNNSDYVIRFPSRGTHTASVSIKVKRENPPSSSAFFYPNKKLLRNIPQVYTDIYDWKAATWVPSVVLKPGESFQQELSLEDAYQFWGRGHYKITFSTTLELLIGKKDGKFAEFCPIRLPVVTTEHFNVTELK